MKGTIKRWAIGKGFGFVIPDDGTSDLFVHASELPDNVSYLPEGSVIEFDVHVEQDGRRQVRRAKVLELGNEQPEIWPAVARPAPPAPPAARPGPRRTTRSPLWTPERRTEIAEQAASILLNVEQSSAGTTDAMRLLLEALSDDARETV